MDKTANSYDDVRLATETAPDKDKGREPGYAGTPDPEIQPNVCAYIGLYRRESELSRPPSKGLNADALFYGTVAQMIQTVG